MASLDGRFLPGEVCSDILSWLPAKAAVRCRSISRAFNAFSCDRFFFISQSHHTRGDSGLFLQRQDGHIEMVLTDACSGVPPGALKFLKDGNRRILGSHGGLVLFDTVQDGSDGRFHLYNPARRTLVQLPRPEGVRIADVMTIGATILFADRHADDVDYAMVCMTPITSDWSDFMECRLYSSQEEARKLISDRLYVGPRNIKFYSPVVGSRGIIYLASDCGRYQRKQPYIVAVDISSRTSEILPLPEKVLTGWEDSEIEIAGHGGHLSLVRCNAENSEFTVWEMEDSKRWRWEQKDQVRMASMGLKPRPVRGFALVSRDTLAFMVKEDVYVYNLRDRGAPKVIRGKEGCFPCMCTYANTLRPCARLEASEITV